MKLYEVNIAIQQCLDKLEIDYETGEILATNDEVMEELHSLEMERQRILEYLAKVVLNNRSEQAAIKAEEKRLKERRQALEKQEERIMQILDRECAGVKTDCGVATFSYRKTSRVEVADNKKACNWLKRKGFKDCYRVSDPEVSKSEVKKLINAGTKVPGVAVVEDYSCNLK